MRPVVGRLSVLVDREDRWLESGSDVERLVFFSDAVFAIAVTLLALEIRLPVMHDPSTHELLEALHGLLPQFYSFAISFWIISVYWLAHHRIFRYIRAYDRRLLVINLFFLMWIVLMPFSASLLGAYGSYQLVLIVYFSHMILTSLSMALLWWYASRGRKLVDPDIDPVVVRYNNARILSLLLIFLLAIGISFFSTAAAGYFVLLLFIVRPLTARYARRRLGRW
jgi:TMEM175 potassium channel family protein